MILIKSNIIIYSGEYIILAQKINDKILTDASDKIGYGHLQRCLSLKRIISIN